jgi:RimJ/RimL family protein N-acetyltransferase
MRDVKGEAKMTGDVNHLGQPIGVAVPEWTGRQQPPRTAMEGRFCRVVPLSPDHHAAELYAANNEDQEGRMWSYLAHGRVASYEDYLAVMNGTWLKEDRQIYTIINLQSASAAGLASYLRIEARAGSIEVGGIMYSPRLQRTAAGTEAMHLMRKGAFDELGYRRYEWRCNALNEASQSAARRLGFQFEGIFRQAQVVKGRNRDTAWFSIVDREWPQIKARLAPENFDSEGIQRCKLRAL